MARRRGKRKDGELLGLALAGSWEVAACLCVGAALARMLFRSLLGANPFALMFIPISDMIFGIAALVFAAIAVFKLILRFACRRPAGSQYSSEEKWTARRPWRTTPTGPIFTPASTLDMRPGKWGLAVLRDMEWKRFEELCAAYCQEKGIRASTTSLGADGGVDVCLYEDLSDPQRCTGIIQCKAWGERFVGVKPVRELRGVMAHKNIEQGFFMAPGSFSEDAQAFAASNSITLIDGPKLLSLIEILPPEAAQRLLDLAMAGDWTTPSCPSCGTKMLARESSKGKFWGCASFPKCRQMLGMRGAVREGSAVNV